MHLASLRAGRRRRLPPAGPRHTQLRSSQARSSPSAPCAPAPARARPRGTSPASCAAWATAWSPSATPCPTATWPARPSSASPTYDDLDRHECTIEEREEYEPHLEEGGIVYAGVDYERILRQAEAEADVILWDGGNNDLPFFVPDLHIVVADPHRPGPRDDATTPARPTPAPADVVRHQQGGHGPAPRTSSRCAQNLRALNPRAVDRSRRPRPIRVDDPEAVRGKRVLVVEDGPTLTHGGMPYGAGWLAARRYGAADRRPAALRRRLDPRRPTASTPASARCCRRWATARQMIAGAGADHQRRRGGPGHRRHADRPGPLPAASTSPSSGCATSCRRSASPTLDDLLEARFARVGGSGAGAIR